MSGNLETAVKEVCQSCDNDSGRMMDIVQAVQARLGCVPGRAIDLIAKAVKTPRVEVESVVTFYAFFSKQAMGKVVIRLCDDIIDRMADADHVALALKDELRVDFGQTTSDGITLERTPCIGMSDQAPAALVNDVVVTDLTSDRAREMVRELRKHMDPSRLVRKLGDGNNAGELIGAMVKNNICQAGEVVFAPIDSGEGLRKALAMTPAEVIRDVKTARLRGRGGAGFPTGMKWDFARAAEGKTRYVLCNADEGEPGTFKDRVILTERADLVFEGMTIAGYAIGAECGVLYLRGEYAYLRRFLENVLRQRREAGLLGESVCGREGFNFDIRIQMGAGAYVCGEETGLISSCEGKRGDPKTRPPFPAQKGYKDCPTVVNNVETFGCVTRILAKGAGWFAQIGSKGSPGTKVLSVSGDVKRPGVYEVPFGISLKELLKLAGAEDAKAVQVGGPSGQMVGRDAFERTICYDDLATGGSVMVFGPQRNILDVAGAFMDFFVEESCGYCTPCRVGNVLLKRKLDEIRAGQGTPEDLEYLKTLGASIKTASRCGLGQTSPNPILTTLENFQDDYRAMLTQLTDGLRPNFDVEAALSEAKAIAGRGSTFLHE